MMKRFFTEELYRKLGCPNLNNIVYFIQSGKRVYGKVALIDFHKKKGYVYLGIVPFKSKPKKS